MQLSTIERRLLTVGTALFGVLHVLAPGILVAAAKRVYSLALAVEFRPRDGTKRRVRLIGVAMLGVAALLRRSDG